MRQIDEVLQTCCENPGDAVGRMALADLFRAQDDHELADAVEAPSGQGLLERVVLAAAALSLPVTARLLWYVHMVLPRVQQPAIVQAEPWGAVPYTPPSGTAGEPPPWWPPRYETVDRVYSDRYVSLNDVDLSALVDEAYDAWRAARTVAPTFNNPGT